MATTKKIGRYFVTTNYNLLEIETKIKESKIHLLNTLNLKEDKEWTLKEKKYFIESCNLGIPLQAIFLFEKKDGSLRILDGKQRIVAIHDYMNNKFCVRDKKFENLSRKEQYNFEDLILKVHIGSYKLSLDDLENICKRLNN